MSAGFEKALKLAGQVKIQQDGGNIYAPEIHYTDALGLGGKSVITSVSTIQNMNQMQMPDLVK
ncbi:MAG: hypothetical protein LBH00_08210 [Planctomycetaceae bacterium]|nr:hypothetical protein [Planctomycetaceae bacterium]